MTVDTHIHVGIGQYVSFEKLLKQLDRYGIEKAVPVQYRRGLGPIARAALYQRKQP